MIALAPGAESNAFASMLADLVKQNLESKPHKRRDFEALARGAGVRVGLVADDADVAVTLEFAAGRLVVHDGIKGIPNVTIRGTADVIMAMSNVPLTRPLALPIPTDRVALEVLSEMIRATRTGDLKVYGLFGNLQQLSRLTRVMSVNG